MGSEKERKGFGYIPVFPVVCLSVLEYNHLLLPNVDFSHVIVVSNWLNRNMDF